MDPESITLRKISQVETDKSRVITFVRGTESKKQRMEQQTEIRTNKKSNSQIRKTMAVTRPGGGGVDEGSIGVKYKVTKGDPTSCGKRALEHGAVVF